MGCMYVGVEQKEKEEREEKALKERQRWKFVEWQVAHFQKKLQKKIQKWREELKRKQWKMHINFGRQTVLEKWRGNEWTAATRQAILLTMDMCIGASGHRGNGASGRAWCQCIPKLAREKSIKKKLSERDRFASHRIVSSRVEYLKTHLLRNIFDNCLRKHSRRPSRMSRCRIYLAGQRMRLFH